MTGIFISYRRDDSAGWAGRLSTDLQERFGQEAVFQDIGAIEAGEDFIDAIERSLESCSAVLVLIGPEWSLVKDKTGARRLDNPEDTVRLEIAQALARKDRLVIPVLVGGAQMPTADELPPELKALARRNAFELSDTRWNYDFEQLVVSLVKKTGLTQKAHPATPSPKPARWLVVLGIVIVVIGAPLAGYWYFVIGPGSSRISIETNQPSAETPVKPAVDLTAAMTPVRQQGSEGSVVGFAVATALEYQLHKKLGEQIIISPRYIYYYTKVQEGKDPHIDTGSFIRDAIKVIQTKGAVSEETWPYLAGDLKSNPPQGIETAKHYKTSKSYPLGNLDEVKSAIQKYGPVIAGIPLFQRGLRLPRNGIIPDPNPGETEVGGTAICIVGYDDKTKLIKFKYSWGSEWGDNGYGYISYDYFNNFFYDAWAITI